MLIEAYFLFGYFEISEFIDDLITDHIMMPPEDVHT